MAKHNLWTKLKNQRSSIQVRILLPTILVMLFQVVLISVVLSMSGTLESLEKSAMDSLYRNAENRSITLENVMVHTWGNLERLELDFSDSVDRYLSRTGRSAGQVFGAPEQEQALLEELSDAVIYALRTTSTTGAFVFFFGEDAPQAESASLSGIYFRDFNPQMTSADNSDLQLEKGPAVIARQAGIPLSSLWSARYALKAEHTEAWASIFAPYTAALEYPGLSTRDLALWSDPHFVDPGSPLDTNACITYTRPLYYNNALVGVVGIEVQTEYLKTFFPSGDVGTMGGFMLLRYPGGESRPDALESTVGVVTGSYIKRLADTGDTLPLTRGDVPYLFHAELEHFDPTTVTVYPLKLYNSNAPHSGRQLALASLMPDSVLFAHSSSIRNSILTSSLVSLVLGVVLILICINLTTKPLLNIVRQLERGRSDELVEERSRTYEVRLLCDTINDMKRKGRNIEIALREEGERYMLALESAVDLFIEYDLGQDCLRIYCFGEDEQALTATVFERFRLESRDAICHPADRKAFLAALMGDHGEALELRLRHSILPGDRGGPDDNGYYWFSFRAARLDSHDEKPDKTIGSATNITAEKLSEFAILEAQRRDITTRAYNRTYGELLLSRLDGREGMSLMAIVAGNFNRLEAYYGRVFAAGILRQMSARMLSWEPELSDLIRWSSDTFVAMCPTTGAANIARRLKAMGREIYQGEQSELHLDIYAGVVNCRESRRPAECLPLALAAAAGGRNGGVGMTDYDAAARDLAGITPPESQPYTSIDISKNAVLPYTLSLFEQTDDLKSIIRMLLQSLGEMFELDRIVICEYDEDFGANQAIYQWSTERLPHYGSAMARIHPEDAATLSGLLDARDTLFYRSGELTQYGDGMRALLCAEDGLSFSALCCVMYEGGAHVGRILFFSADPEREPTEGEIFSLYEVTKIIATRFNLEKSHSASSAKSEFLSKMSHEIRTPMNAIVGFTRMAKDAGGDTGQVQNALEKIDVSARHLLALINDILDMSRIESGKLLVEPQPFSLAGFVEGLDALMRPQFEDKGLQFTVRADIVHPLVAGDEQKLRQVLINLLGNAVKFTQAGGATLNVHQAEDGSCRFSVLDTGVGISPEDQYHIFNAFEQSAASNQAAGNPMGTGLGLAISNNLVSAMGGRIELHSAPKEGSEFFFTLSLPPCEDEDEFQPDMGHGHSPDILHGRRALLVDDNEVNLEIAVFILEDMGLICEVARDGQEAVDMFQNSQPGYYDLIIMDINMPVMDGFTATREIRRRTERPDARAIPIVAMTANAFNEDSKKSLDAGMNAHVAKPIDANFLQETLISLFNHTD